MEELKLWCENLILSVIAILLIELLIPESMENKKYIKVISGIFLMFMVLNPFIEILNGKSDFNIKDYFGYKEVSSDSYEKIDSKIKDVYIIALEEKIKEASIDFANVKNVFITFDLKCENVEKLELKVESKKENYDENVYKEFLANSFQIDKELIFISYS